jgi:hypothetical protein
MKRLFIIMLVAGILASLCLLFSSPNYWPLSASLSLLIGIILFVFRKKRSFWLTTACFSIYTGFAIWYLLIGASPLLIISGEIFAFTCWELLVFSSGLKGNIQHPESQQLVLRHIHVLLPTMFLAWLMSIIFLNIHFKVPFLILLAAGGMGIFGFFLFYRRADT